MKKFIFESKDDWAGLIVRLTLGLILFPHGAQKLLGWFGGYGFEGTMGFFTETMNLPWIVGFAVIILEFFGALALIIGFASRVWSLAFGFLMIGIIFTSHLQNGFFMDWEGTMAGEGFEYHLLIIGLCLAGLINGSGKYAIDNKINGLTA